MKTPLLYFFATIGIIGTIIVVVKVIRLVQHENQIQNYYNNCEKVEIGMTLEEARAMIGDLKYQYWANDELSAEIILYHDNDELKYSLEYPMIFAGSDNMRIYFDPNTLLVVEKFCGER